MASDFLSRGIDYLGDLGAKLRDLQGFRTLAHELVQNADDAPTAQLLSFDFSDQALIVDNDGYFSECPDVRTDECAWKEDGFHNYRCDFHRFRRIASGDNIQTTLFENLESYCRAGHTRLSHAGWAGF